MYKKAVKTLLISISLMSFNMSFNISFAKDGGFIDSQSEIQKVYNVGFRDGLGVLSATMIAYALTVKSSGYDGELTNKEIVKLFKISEDVSRCVNDNSILHSQEIASICKKEITLFFGNTNLYLANMQSHWKEMVDSGMDIQVIK